MRAFHDPDVVVALDEMVQVVAASRAKALAEEARVVHVLEAFVGFARDQLDSTRSAVAAEVSSWIEQYGLGALEPSQLGWEPFSAFSIERDETRWTQWLASLWTPTQNGTVARIAWQAFCRAAAEAAPHEPLDPAVATPREWTAAANTLPSVTAEESFEDERARGRFDLLARSAGLVAVIENKIDADWHDEAGLQDQKYAAKAIDIQRKAGATHVGLVLLSARPNPDTRGWTLVTYAHLARHLRRGLRPLVEVPAMPGALFELAPLLHTIHAIEKHLLGVAPPSAPAPHAKLRDLHKILDALATLLEENT